MFRNIRGWGETGMFRGKPTKLHVQDERRAEEIIHQIRTLRPHLVGLAEVFDPKIALKIREAVSGIYPYYFASPYPEMNGVEGLASRLLLNWPRLGTKILGKADRVVDLLFDSHSQDGLLMSAFRYVDGEDRFMRCVHPMFDGEFAWGGGLLFLSQFPIDEGLSRFIDHPDRADLEVFARKGVLEIVVNPPGLPPLTVLLTHLQDGKSGRAGEARKEQLLHLRELIRSSPYRVILMGDLNIDEGSVEEFRLLEEIFKEAGAVDTFRLLYPDRVRHPGITFDLQPFADRFELHVPPERLRIDYLIARALGLRVVHTEVVPEKEAASDHLAVTGAAEYAPC